MEISNANAQPVWWMVSAPSMTAYAGFAHALARALGATGHEGVAVIHHEIQFLGEHIREKHVEIFHPQQFMAAGFIDNSDYAKGSKSLSSQPTVRCHLKVSLIIAMGDDIKISPHKIEAFLRGARLAGGSLVKYHRTCCDIETHKGCADYVGSGYVIIERQDLMCKNSEDRDCIDTFLRVTRRYTNSWNNNSKPIDCQNNDNAWVVPTCLGYVGISPLEKRNKVRNELPHLYVEPLIGLVQYKNIREAELELWRYLNREPNVFILSTK